MCTYLYTLLHLIHSSCVLSSLVSNVRNNRTALFSHLLCILHYATTSLRITTLTLTNTNHMTAEKCFNAVLYTLRIYSTTVLQSDRISSFFAFCFKRLISPCFLEPILNTSLRLPNYEPTSHFSSLCKKKKSALFWYKKIKVHSSLIIRMALSYSFPSWLDLLGIPITLPSVA